MRIVWISGVIGFGLFVALVTTVAVFSQRDEDILPEIQALLAEAAPGQHSVAYQYLVGLDGPAHLSLEEAGEQVLGWISGHDVYYEDIATIGTLYPEPYPFDEDSRLPRPEGDMFCRVSEGDCLLRLLTISAWSSEALEEYPALHTRYRQLLQASDYRTFSRPDVTEWIPHYAHLVSAARLEQLAALALFHQGDTEQAVARAAHHLERLRVWLAMQDQLVGKMVLAALVRDTVIINSAMMRQAGKWQPIAGLTEAERSVRPALAREVQAAHRVYLSLDRHPDFFQHSADGSHMQMPGWLVRAIYKPVMTLNASFVPYREALVHDAMELPQFAEAMATRTPPDVPPSWARNAAGSMLVRVSVPDLSRYLARTMDLDVLIELHNQFGAGMLQPDGPEEFGSPYGPLYSDIYRLDNPKRICAQGPHPDTENYRCLPLLPEEV